MAQRSGSTSTSTLLTTASSPTSTQSVSRTSPSITQASRTVVQSAAASQTMSDPSSPGSGKDYFYVVVAIAIIILTVALTVGHRVRRKKMLRATATTRQTVLSYDVEIGRHPRNMHRTRRFHEHSRSTNSATGEEREEGLDDSGEAPPPYKRDEAGAERQLREERTSHAGAQITIPLRTFQRTATEPSKPPDYETSVVELGGSSSRQPADVGPRIEAAQV